MILFFKNLFNHFASINKNVSQNKGMTYLELIVVLTIFAIVSSVVIFNYKSFQAKVDINNLIDDVALRIVGAQKNAISGKLSPLTSDITWKPAYGVYFKASSSKDFIYFTDVDNSGHCSSPQCLYPFVVGGEVTDIITITKGNFIPSDGLGVVGDGCNVPLLNDLSFVFKRPNSAPTIYTTTPIDAGCIPSYYYVKVSSSDDIVGTIKVYPSGRIQIN